MGSWMFWSKKPNDADVESIAARNLFEAVAALVLKHTATLQTEVYATSRQLRGYCDEQIRKADASKKTARYNRLQRAWRKLTGLETLERELELERNRSIQALRTVADGLKRIGDSAVLDKKEFYAACLIKARDMQDAAKGAKNASDKAFFDAVGLSLAQMAQRFADKTDKQGATDATDNQK